MNEINDIIIKKIDTAYNEEFDQFSEVIVYNSELKRSKYAIMGKRSKSGNCEDTRLSPFVDVMDILHNRKDTSKLYFFGKKKDEWYVYCVNSLTHGDYKEECYTKTYFPGEYRSCYKLTEDLYVINTDEGGLLFDLNKMMIISDVFNQMYLNCNDFNEYGFPKGQIVFEKKYNVAGYELLMYGSIDYNGRIYSKLLCDNPRFLFDTPLDESEPNYDKLDNIGVLNTILNRLVQDKKKKK